MRDTVEAQPEGVAPVDEPGFMEPLTENGSLTLGSAVATVHGVPQKLRLGLQLEIEKERQEWHNRRANVMLYALGFVIQWSKVVKYPGRGYPNGHGAAPCGFFFSLNRRFRPERSQ